MEFQKEDSYSAILHDSLGVGFLEISNATVYNFNKYRIYNPQS